MYEEFIRNRITQLRVQRGVSARDMSLSLGQNDSYINRIENGKALPSLSVLFYICEYFDITPRQFFDEGDVYPNQLAAVIENLKRLDAEALSYIAGIAERLAGK